ncbi:MAG: hypothetical protein K8T89_11765 [Planctomycetes bacterium]|nr:hypothetical protein [Planctomycetota bacterium]
MATDHDTPNSDVDPQSIKQGFETDRLDLRAIIYVPIALLITFGMAYTVVTLLINYMRAPVKDPNTNSLAAARNDVHLRDRLGRISSTDPQAEVKQPRLDGADRLQPDPLPPAVEAPYYVKSTDKTKDGNSTPYAPEDLRPSSALGISLGLQSFNWIDSKEKTLRIPIDEAMKAMLDMKSGSKTFFSVQTKKVEKKDPKTGETKTVEVPVELSDLLKTLPTSANPQAGFTPKAAPKDAAHGGGH